MSEDVKQVIENFGQAFEEFKKVNDRFLMTKLMVKVLLV